MESKKCASFILVKGSKFLAEKRTASKEIDPGKLGVPGGHCMENESPEDALEREMMEELGVKPLKREFLCRLFYENPFEEQLIYYFTVEEWLGEPKALEAAELLWLDAGESRMVDIEPDRKAVEIYFEKKSLGKNEKAESIY